MSLLTVARLSVTPVRSMALSHPESVELTPWGVIEDRRFALFTADGRLLDATSDGRLLRVRAECDADAERLTLHFPSEGTVTGTWTLGDVVVAQAYGRRFAAREVIGPWAEVLSAYCGQTVRLLRSERRGDDRDRAPVSVVSERSVAELSRRVAGEAGIDARRFRMLIEVAGGDAHQEDGWMGRRVRIGAAEIAITVPVARCVITTLNPATGERDLPTLRVIREYRGVQDREIRFGVYADVVIPGRIRRGDPVTLE